MSARTHLTICVLGCFIPMLTTQPSVSYLRTPVQSAIQKPNSRAVPSNLAVLASLKVGAET